MRDTEIERERESCLPPCDTTTPWAVGECRINSLEKSKNLKEFNSLTGSQRMQKRFGKQRKVHNKRKAARRAMG